MGRAIIRWANQYPRRAQLIGENAEDLIRVGGSKRRGSEGRLIGRPAFGGRHLHRIPIVKIHRPGFHAQPDLSQVIGARDAIRLFPCLRQCGQQQRCQYGNDGNDHQQLDQGECSFLLM